MRSNYKRLGDYIEPCNEKNTGNLIKELRGISNQKFFQKAKTNTIGIDLSKYRVVRTGQFAFNRATTRNGDKISIALREKEDCIVSPSYRMFKSKDENILNSEYLMMWFRRPEFDRYARFKSHGSAHEFFDLDEMYEVELPVPSIQKQREIVKEYNTIVNRIKLNDQLNRKLEETAQALYKHWFVDFEFPDENGQPYKSSGGKLVYNEELDQEIPADWVYSNLDSLGEKIFSGGTPSTNESTYWGDEFYWLSSGETRETVIIDSERMITQEGVNNSSTKLARIGDSIMASAGQGKTRGQTSFCKIDAYFNQSILCIRPISETYESFIFFTLNSKYHELRNESDSQAIRGSLNKENLSNLIIIIPDEKVLKAYHKTGVIILNKIYMNQCMSKELTKMKSLVLAKMSKVESLKTEQVL